MKPIAREIRSKVRAQTIVLCGAILFAAVIFKFDVVLGALSTFFGIMRPFLLGMVLALLLAPLAKTLERFFTFLFGRKKPHPRLCRTLALVLTYLLLLGALIGLSAIIVPQLVASVGSLSVKVANFVREQSPAITAMLDNGSLFGFDLSSLVSAWESMVGSILTYSTKALLSIVSISAGIGNSVANFFITVTFSVYILLYSVQLSAQSKKITYALFKRDTAQQLIFWTRKTHSIFSGYIVGKIMDSLIIGILCYLCMLLLRFDYALLISVTVCVTNILPYFGPIIGGIIGCFILLMVSPLQSLLFLVLILVLQQLDGNVIGPRILGGTLGISPFWILLSIMVGSGIWGIVGILVAIPCMGLIYAIIKTVSEARLTDKGMPIDTKSYFGKEEPPVTDIPAERETKA